MKQIPADLPIQRMRLEDPFSTTGIDFADPLNVLYHQPKGGDKFIFNFEDTPQAKKPKSQIKQRLLKTRKRKPK